MSRVLILFTVLLGACTGEVEPGTLSAMTYNAGLAVGFVPAAEERSEGTARAVVDVGADITCLQEVWEPEHVAMFQDAAADSQPHTFFPEARQEASDTPACATTELDALVTCMNDNCSDACVDELPSCLLSSCPLQFIQLSKPCSRCTQANVGAEPDTIREICTDRTVEFTYGGSFGTGILSKHPIASVEEEVFASTTSRRSVLHAVVEHPAGEVDVYCTHLTADLSPIPYPREGGGTWKSEQETQVREMVAFVEETSSHDMVLLMGDMNNGPDVGDSVAEFPDHYALLEESGLDNPYVSSSGPCTFCVDNLLRGADSDASNRVIDHILLELAGDISTSRVLDEPIETSSCGEPIDGHLSDHYGVRVDVVLSDPAP